MDEDFPKHLQNMEKEIAELKRPVVNERNLIHRQTWVNNQTSRICMESFWKVGGLALHVEIIRDAYDFQSSAVIHKMTVQGWKPVASIPYTQMASMQCNAFDAHSRSGQKVLDRYTEKPFGEDESKLIELALAILL